MRALPLLVLLIPWPAEALRFTLGVASDLTPLVVDTGPPAREGTPLRFGFRPVLELEANHHLAFGAYAPFTVVRTGEQSSAASSGAESVFGLSVSGRYPVLRANGPEEILVYGTARGGFGTVNGRAGPFLGLAVGATATWLETGRGLFVELSLSRLAIGRWEGAPFDLERVMLGVSLGLVFRLGGEDWRL